MNIIGKGGSQNLKLKVGCLSGHSAKQTFIFMFLFGTFSYFYTSAKWIIKTDNEYYD